MVDWKTYIRAQLGPLTDDPARDLEVVEELAQHLHTRYAEALAAGASEAEARRTAIEDLGNHAQLLRGIRRTQRRSPNLRPRLAPPPTERRWLVGELPRDLRYAARLLVRNPGFTLVAVLTLALGVGANTAIFTVVNAVLLQPPPFESPDRLVVVGDQPPDARGELTGNTGYTTFIDWRDRTRSVESLVAIRNWSGTLTGQGDAERLVAMRVSWNYFHMLGVAPALGRDFRAAEDRPDTRYVVILSDALWKRRFGGDPGIVGRAIVLNDRPFTVVGILPAAFRPVISGHFYQPAELWAPLGYDVAERSACRSCQHLKVLGRLAPGRSVEQARSELEAVHRTMRAAHPTDYANVPLVVAPLTLELTGRIQPMLYVLTGAVGFVLLIACANVANLLLARAGARHAELAVRAALGASRRRLVQQLLTESALLGTIGGVLGIVACAVALPILLQLAPARLVGQQQIVVDRTVLGFALLVSMSTTLVFGLMPALQTARVDEQSILRQSSRSLLGASSPVARRVLVVVDLALALVLLLGATLMLRSVQRLMAVQPGFDTDRVLTAQLAFVGKAWAEDSEVLRAVDAILDRVRVLPGVEAAAVSGQVPLGGNMDTWGFHIERRMAANTAEDPSVERYSVSPDYFRAMRIPLLRGRGFTLMDGPKAPEVLVIGETTARLLWPGDDPMGKRVRIGSATSGPWRTIVGVVGDVRHYEVATTPTPQMYAPQAQLTDSFPVLTIRATGDPIALVKAVREAVAAVDRRVPVYDVATTRELVGRSLRPYTFVMLLLACFAGIALVMAAVGVYGVVSSVVSQRTRELGIRIALGAQRGDLVRLLVRGGLVLALTGVAIGLALGAVMGRWLGSLTYEVSAIDPSTFTVCGLLLGLVALVAHWLPIRRALRLDPVEALRQE